jgi:two-component system, cell cycle sensor histidine kinase and response regulator CckA
MAYVGKNDPSEGGFAWLNAVLANVNDAVLATDAEGGLLFLNAPAATILGVEGFTTLGASVDTLLQLSHERTGQPLSNPVREALKLGAPVSIAPQTCLRGAGGKEYLIEGVAQPVHGAATEMTGALMVFRDLGPRRRLEESLRQSQKCELIGQLRDGISHDLNNLMTIVIGYSDVLLNKVRGSGIAGLAEFLTEIKTAAQKATLLTQQVLALGRNRLVQPTLVNLNELLSSMEKTLGRVVGERIRITLKPAGDVPLVLIDPLQMMQMILHICLNSREAIAKSGEIVLATRKAPAAHPANGASVSARAELIITDNGTGMDAETLARAREPFYTTRAENKGMGLPVVERMLRAAGGELRLESEPGRGCTVIFSIPASAAQAGPQPATVPSAPAPAANTGGTILLVEDAERVRRLLARVLEDAGYTVLHAADGRAGLELCHQYDGQIQLLITDVIMPEMSGPELVKSLTGMKQQPRVLFLSGYAGDELERQGLDHTRYHFLQKPFLGEALLRKVREVLGGSRK